MALIETIPVKEDYRRKMAMRLMQEGTDASPIQHWAQGLARLGQGALGGYEMHLADQKDKETEAGNNSALIAALERFGAPAASAAPAAPQPSPQRPTATPAPANPAMQGNVPAALAGPRPGGPVMPSAKVWGDQEAEDAGLYEPTKVASVGPVPIPAPRPADAPQMAGLSPAPATQAASPAPIAPSPTSDQMGAAKGRLIEMLRSDNPQVRRLGQSMAQTMLTNQLSGKDKLEKLNDSTLFDPRTGRAIAVPGAEKPIVVGKDQRLVKDGKVIVDQLPDKAVKITLANGQEVTAIQNGDGSFRIPEVQGAATVTPKLSEGERDQIIKDEDTRAAGESALSAIREARKLNDKAFSGAGAGVRAWVARNSPVDLGMVNSGLSREGGKATTQLDNLLTEQALGSMKAIFGGNPTEGERKVLLDLQASSSKSPEERKEILDRAEKMMVRRIQMSGERANSIRGGSYFKPGGGNAPPSQADALKQKYGLD